MDGLPGFVISVFLISLSGVLAPGPVMAVTVARGATNPHAGAWVAAGHAAVELPLLALIYFGVGAAFNYEPVRVAIGALGGFSLLAMGVMMLRSKVADLPESAPAGRGPFASGAILSAANPYFLVWWATAGAALVGQALGFGLLGFVLLVIVHESCDLLWLWAMSGVAFRGRKLFGPRMQRATNLVAGMTLLYFGGYFIYGAGKLLAG